MLIIFNLFPYEQSKCERYWCDEMNEPFEIPGRGFTVTVTGKKVYADYKIRDMTIRSVSAHARLILQCVQTDWLIYTSTRFHQVIDQSAKPLKLKHFFFTAWPDHGVPQHPYTLVKFIQHVRKMLLNSPAPLVVHCRCVWIVMHRCFISCG